jgi:hypothetical protein
MIPRSQLLCSCRPMRRIWDGHFATVTWKGMLENIAQRLLMADRKLMSAVQGQNYAPTSDEKLTIAARPQDGRERTLCETVVGGTARGLGNRSPGPNSSPGMLRSSW